MANNQKAGVFTYVRYTRDGGQREITALLNQPQRKRVGKTERDRSNTKRAKTA